MTGDDRIYMAMFGVILLLLLYIAVHMARESWSWPKHRSLFWGVAVAIFLAVEALCFVGWAAVPLVALGVVIVVVTVGAFFAALML